jgi:hypothetical protein
VTDNNTWLKDSDKTCDHIRRATELGFTKSSDRGLPEIWDSELVKSIRKIHANLSNIAEYEEKEASNHISEVDKQKELSNL